MIEIKKWMDRKVLYVAERASDVRTALEEAVKEKADLRSADLRSADLRSADLRFADLGSADLRFADLRSADLGSADLRSADLGSADLRSADLGFADLRSADLRSADLGSADLRSADLRFADLGSADLGSADLGSADLGSADLRFADLRSADLGSANLRFADLGSANLTPSHPLWAFRTDLWAVLDEVAAEVPGLRKALLAAQVDGSVYIGKCACLVGTIAKVRHVDAASLPISMDPSRPAERWFFPIREGDTPLPIGDLPEEVSEGVFRASLAVQWIDEWRISRTQIAAVFAEAVAA